MVLFIVLWIFVLTGLTSHEFAVKLLQEYKVAVVPGTAFGECGEGFVRCCFATELSDLKTAISRISDFVQQHSKSGAKAS